jgi:hypothetical protein
MASFADAINALVAERDRQFVERIAKEYNLNFEELNQKYLETAEMAIKVPRKYTKKAKEPKSVEVVEGSAPDAKDVTKAPKDKPCCTAQTSKKEPCKFSALKGEVFCKRHLKQSLGETEPKERKAKKEPKAKKPDQPVHTHPLTETDEACDLCASHGNPLEEAEQDFEVVAPHTGPVKQLTTAQRLEALLNEGLSDDEADDASELGCDVEEYEEDD